MKTVEGLFSKHDHPFKDIYFFEDIIVSLEKKYTLKEMATFIYPLTMIEPTDICINKDNCEEDIFVNISNMTKYKEMGEMYYSAIIYLKMLKMLPMEAFDVDTRTVYDTFKHYNIKWKKDIHEGE